VSCAGIIIGATGASNTLDVAGGTTKLSAGGGELHVGSHVTTWGSQRFNGLRVSEGAILQDAGSFYIGRSRSTNTNEVDHSNYIHVSGGAFTIGYGEAASSISNQTFIIDGAISTNLGVVSVGYTSGGRAVGNRLVLANGARIWTSGEVRVGSTNTRWTSCTAEENIVIVAGGRSGAATWDMGGAVLSVGVVYQADAPARGNKFVLQPDGRVINAGNIFIGRGKGTLTDNALVLAGGSISGKSLTIAKDNGIDVALSASGLKPILIEGDVAVAEGAYINPQIAASRDGVAPPSAGRHLILAWQGVAKDIAANLKLHENANTRRWKLEIDEENKRVFLAYTP
jgi:hypothetical protein